MKYVLRKSFALRQLSRLPDVAARLVVPSRNFLLDMFPSFSRDYLANLFLANSKGSSDVDLSFAVGKALTDGSDLIGREGSLASDIRAGQSVSVLYDGVALIAAPCGPLQITRNIVSSVVVNMGYFWKLIGVLMPGHGNQNMGTKVPGDSFIINQRKSQVSVFIEIGRKHLGGFTAGYGLPFPSIALSEGLYLPKAANASSIRNFVASLKDRYRAPFFRKILGFFRHGVLLLLGGKDSITSYGEFVKMEVVPCLSH